WSRATLAAAREACWAAYGVPLREPLKPMAPAEDQHMVRPSVSVMVICVLLNDAATYTTPCGTTRRSRFFLNSFFRFAAAGFAGAPASGVPAAAFGSFATIHSVSFQAKILNLAKPGRSSAAPLQRNFASPSCRRSSSWLRRRRGADPCGYARWCGFAGRE